MFATDLVTYVGQPIAAVAADHPETARRALDAIAVDYDVLEPLIDAEAAIAAGSVFRQLRILHGDPDAAAATAGAVAVEATYEIGMQDQAFLGLEGALAIPDSGGGGVELHVATQWLHEDRKQIAACLGLPEQRVRLVLGGVGGAFGAREDISLQVHCCLLALRLGRPVKMHYSRHESFVGHVHRHPASIWMKHWATPDGDLLRVDARFVLDGGAFMSTSPAVLLNAVTHAQGPYRCRSANVEGYAVRTNHLPCGAMRGFGVVQACFAHESQMDRLAEALGIDPVDLRLRNVIRTGDRLIHGQVMDSVAPVEQCILETVAMPFPDEPVGGRDGDPMRLPGGSGRTADVHHVFRGIGYGVSMKNLMYSEGFDDYSTARVTLCRDPDGLVATVKFATAEVGQGFVVLAQQIARTVLGVERVEIGRIDTTVGSAGSTSASRQTWMSGGAVQAACRAVLSRTVERYGTVDDLPLGEVIEETAEYHHRRTEELDDDGQGDCHTAWAFVAHRAVVDVDPELGLVKVVQVATAQDVGVALNPLSVIGQIEGGVAQGLGLAVMEEIVQVDGRIRNASFTDYLLPTMLDMPPVVASMIEEYEPHAPLGAKGVGEPPCISVTPAIVAAIRDAVRRAGGDPASLTRVPVRPTDIVATGNVTVHG